MRSSEDVYHKGQAVFKYQIDVLVNGSWLDVTSRGKSVGVGTVDFLGRGLRDGIAAAAKLRWRCLVARGPSVTLSSVDLYMAVPPTSNV